MNGQTGRARLGWQGLGLIAAGVALVQGTQAKAVDVVNAPYSYGFASAFGPYVANGQTSQVQAEIANGTVGTVYDSTGGSSATTSHSADNSVNSARVLSNTAIAASATGDLSLGAVRASVSIANAPIARGFAESRIKDTVFFNNTSGGIVYLPFSFGFDGTITDPRDFGSTASAIFSITGAQSACADGSYGTCYGDHALYLQNGGVASLTTVIGYASNGRYNGVQQGGAFFFNAPDNVDLTNYTVAKNWTAGGGFYNTVVSAVLAVPVGASRLGYDLRLILDCSQVGTTCDFGNTSKFGFATLPSGIGITSASGVFPVSIAAGGVPEPATWALLLTGFGMVGAAARRRARTVAA